MKAEGGRRNVAAVAHSRIRGWIGERGCPAEAAREFAWVSCPTTISPMTRIETRSANWPLRIFWIAVLTAIAAYVVAWPLAQRGAIENTLPTGGEAAPEVLLADLIFARAMEVVIAAWVFMLGASIGSFLNVVVYRLPRGITLLGTSHCPRCSKPILFRDNVPVLGWLMLRGRCRSCALPISIRYPLVEAIAGSLFLVLAFCELFSGADNLMRPSPWPDVGVVLFIAEPHWALVRLVVFHAFLLSVLLAGAAIRIDDQRLPRSLILTALAVGFLGPLLWPELSPRHWAELIAADLPMMDWSSRFAAMRFAAVGVAAGFYIGGRIDMRWPSPTAPAFSIAGLFLGWQAALSLAAMAIVLEFVLLALFASPRRGWALRLNWACLLIAVLLQLMLWRRLFSLSWWPGSKWTLLAVLAWIALLVLGTLALRVMRIAAFNRSKTE